MALSELHVKNAKPGNKQRKMADGGGLYLLVKPNGSKYWRLKYRILGKEKTLALGVYLDTSLKDAREGRDKARKLLAKGIDPSQKKQAEKAAQAGAESFEAVAREWHSRNKPRWSESYGKAILTRLEANIFPWLGKQSISEIEPPDVLAALRRTENRGILDTAHRVKGYCGQVFRYAVATGRAKRDPTADLKGALPPTKKQHYATITDPQAVGELLRAIGGFSGTLVVECALRLAPYVFVRPGELRRAEWAEIDLDHGVWRIPAEKTKMSSTHIVPLSNQAIEILREIHAVTGQGRYVFPSVRTNKRPMSENTINVALRRIGYDKEEMTGHGFRAMASTILHEQGWPSDVIERQLAHAERNSVKAAYNHAEHLSDRKRMMQVWADYLDKLRCGADIVSIGSARRKK